MPEIKWDIKRGAQTYRSIFTSRLQRWISTGRVKPGEVVVWRSGLSGWRRPEGLDELLPYFERFEKSRLRKKREKKKKQKEEFLPLKREVKNILVIDDEKDMCWLLSNALRIKGYNVTIATTRKEGMACLKKEPPVLVFLDLKLPDGDGLRLLSKIKKISPQTLVTIISAYGSEEIKEKARKRGAYAFIDKPFTEERILRSIKKLNRQVKRELRWRRYLS
jgi:CheY-like chemotaxis protein